MTSRSLLLDIGNRRIKRAVANGKGEFLGLESFAIPSTGAWPTVEKQVGEWVQAAQEVRVCSSNPQALLRLARGPLKAARRLQVYSAEVDAWPLEVASRGTGADRVLGAFAAWRRSAGPVIVADLGTAWTLDVVDQEGVFRGGAIGLGLGATEDALADRCPHLDAPLKGHYARIPSDTAGAVACGTRGALAASLEGLAWHFEQDIGVPAQRFLTGGDRELIAPLMLDHWMQAEHLVLDGLAKLDLEPHSAG